MPRVKTGVAAKSDYKRPRRCTGCGQPIVKGDRYYTWLKRYGPVDGFFRHVACGAPRPSELSGRKTAVIEDAVLDWTAPGADVTPLESIDFEEVPDTLELEPGAFEDPTESVASVAEEVADEYESGVDNMPEGLQYGPTGEAMRDVTERLREWAQELRDKAGEDITVDLPPYGPDDTDDNWLEAAETALNDAWEERVSDLEQLLGEMPEYEG
jgi:hypothetical protein